ncbi:aromatic ring-hydroxylating oxygenase subunit alpha [Rhodohalobacter mucosus]|uniref:(2Fe-2S)-binding protein n=1 Tax=Rhodohalobacter mucosus TaxID=2079485 RepID=A0A316TVC9_9BACT|nr:aromatic ring-hydroxylating dioxygenase subunit alpha [Rhodohalobacter mucosus]PWN07249.1 (2Fe-2S)-binding protein [Rhodohalobacter mucosus]
MTLPPFIHPDDLKQPSVEQAHTIPSEWYTHPGMDAVESEAIFDMEWHLAGHISQLPEPGDSLCIQAGKNPVNIIRDEGKMVRAYFNVCKHRGGPLTVKKGTTTVLQCGYHGWTYLADGSLRGIPHWKHVELFDKKDFGLQPVECEVWNGLIFIHTGKKSSPLRDVFKGIDDRIHPLSFEKYQFCKKTSDPIGCNWKVYADNYLEGYHIPIVHPELAGLLDYNSYVTELHDHYSLQYSPFKNNKADNLYGADNGEAFYYFIYPNIMLNILPGRLQTNVIRPVDEKNCIVDFYYYYLNPENPDVARMIEEDIAYSETIQQEDIEICEAVQRGLRSSAYDKGRFSVEREAGVYHFQSLLKQSFRRYFSE